MLAVHALALLLASTQFPPQTDMGPLTAVVLLASALLVLVCRLKGAPPRWRWRRLEANRKAPRARLAP